MTRVLSSLRTARRARLAYRSLFTVHSSRLLELGLVVAPALPCPALVFADRLVFDHAPDEGRDVGLVAVLALLELPFLSGGEYGRFGYLFEFHLRTVKQ